MGSKENDVEQLKTIWKKKGLGSRQQATDEGLLVLAQQPELMSIEHFSLTGFENASASRSIGFRELVNSTYFAHIQTLSFTNVCFCVESLQALLSSIYLSSWKQLSFCYSLQALAIHQPEKQSLVSVLADAPLITLTQLYLANNQLHSIDLKTLASSKYLMNLESLDVSNNEIGDEGVSALCGSSSFPRFKKLSLARNLLSVASARTLLAWSQLDQLEYLQLAGNAFSDVEQTAYDQGAALFVSPADPEALALRARLGNRLVL